MENHPSDPSPENPTSTPAAAEPAYPPSEPVAEPALAPETPEVIEEPKAAEAPEPADPLLVLAHAAKAARLSPADEDHAVTLLKERLTGGRAGIASAVPAMTEGLPWVVVVNAVSAIWEKLSLVMRRHLLSALAKTETEPARRLRLSLARGLFKIDPPAGLKLAAQAAAALKDPENGALSGKHRQYFFNVFIGKGKPWLLQLPLGDLKAADAEALSHAAIESFSFCPPFSQLSVLRWIHGAGRFKKIGESDLAAIVKSVSRWNVKLQRQLKAEIAELPPEVEAVLKPEASKPVVPEEKTAEKPPVKKPAAEPQPSEPAEIEEEEPKTEPAAEGEESAETEPQAGEPQAEAEEVQAEPGTTQGHPERREKLTREQRRHEKQERRKQEQEARRAGEQQRRPFDAREALRGIESYINNLRGELESAKTQLHRQEKQKIRIPRSEELLPTEEVEALRRHNIRLELTVAELRAELEDLASNHEAIAESRLLHTGEPLGEDNVGALKALLAIKLQEAFETYHAMRLEPLDKVFRLDYRDLLGSVFDVLLSQGVPLKKAPPKP